MVKRPTGVIVSYLDPVGEIIEKEISGFPARVFMHEMDHVNG